ncbi:MAG: 6-bladed beta-propeller [Clostridia bacterium]|nr:6-bladed beta-propeller [Clostridia bacterium]
MKTQRLLSVFLIVAIISGSLIIGWLIYNQRDEDAGVFPAGILEMPEAEFKFAIGGDGSKPDSVMSEPLGVDIADNGDIYVADTLNNRIKVFNKYGEFKLNFGDKNHVYLPSDLVIRDENVFVVDGKNSRIQIFELKGKFVKTFAGPEIGKKIGAWIPSAITISEMGDIYVTDVFFHRVIVFDNKGNIKRYFGLPGNGQGQLMYPNGIAVNDYGYVYVADSNNGRIQVFDEKGKFVNTLSINDQTQKIVMPRGIYLSRQGLLYVADTFMHRISVFDVDKDVVTDTITFGSRGTGNDQMNFPNDISIRNNVLVIADRANNRVLVYNIK